MKKAVGYGLMLKPFAKTVRLASGGKAESMTARTLTTEAINALKNVDRAERAYVKALKAGTKKAETDRFVERIKTAALTADRRFQDWRDMIARVHGPDTFGPKG